MPNLLRDSVSDSSDELERMEQPPAAIFLLLKKIITKIRYHTNKKFPFPPQKENKKPKLYSLKSVPKLNLRNKN